MRALQITQSITSQETRSVEAYFTEIGKVRLISAEEEALLAQKIRQGDRAALDRLVRTNLRFVVSVAKKYQHQGVPLSDLISEGNLGLIQAAFKFDETRGFKFISYAVWWIRQSILLAISEQSRMIRLPQNLVNVLTKAGKAAASLEQQQERAPTPEELAGFLGIPPAQLSDALYFAPNTSSYDAPLPGGEEGSGLLDRLASAAPADLPVRNILAGEALSELLNILSERECRVLMLTYGLGGQPELSPAAIAERIGMSVATVHQTRNKALEKLRGNASVRELFGN